MIGAGIAALAWAGVLLGATTPAAPPDSSCLPAGWRVREIAAAALQPNERLEEAHVLRWRIAEDERPLRVENALLWARVHGWPAGRKTWVLANVFRHPREKQPPPQWALAHVFDVDSFHGRTVHRAPPGLAQLDTLRQVSWWDTSLHGFGVIAHGDCPDGWRAAFGVAPPPDSLADR